VDETGDELPDVLPGEESTAWPEPEASSLGDRNVHETRFEEGAIQAEREPPSPLEQPSGFEVEQPSGFEVEEPSGFDENPSAHAAKQGFVSPPANETPLVELEPEPLLEPDAMGFHSEE
jgi:hypothetical protein